MKILSIDVGIKNLAYCLLEKSEDPNSHYRIVQWDVVNLSEDKAFLCGFVDEKTETVCNKPAKFKKNDVCFCTKHSKKQEYQIPNPD